MPAPQTEILITVDGVEKERHVLAPGDYVIGRNPDCAVRIEGELVSRRHAKLTLNDGHSLIEDLGSRSGTFVDDAPVKQPTRLGPGAKIRIGAATVTLHPVQDADRTVITGTIAAPTAAQPHSPAQETIRKLLPEEMLREQRYDIGEVIAQGGMGSILDAHEAAIERKVAMKVLLDPEDQDAVSRFIIEAKVTGQLEHPNIVPIYELGVDENGQPFYTMKMVRGITLEKSRWSCSPRASPRRR